MSKTKRKSVIKAVREGATTSLEVSAVTNLPVNFCSAYLDQFVRAGILHRAGRRQFPQSRRPVTVYALSRHIP